MATQTPRARWRERVARRPLERHPDDGWTMADPIPWPRATRVAMRGLARALCPPPPAPWSAAIEDALEDTLRRSLRYMPRLFALGLVGAIHALDLAPIWFAREMSRLSDLDREAAAELLDQVAATRIGGNLVFAGRMSILSLYFDLDEVHEALGYAPTRWMRDRVVLRARILDGTLGEEDAPGSGVQGVS